MAKQAVGTVERHVEKGVLALCGLALLGTIAVYLVKSPNQANIADELVGPDAVYDAVARQGENLRLGMLNAREDVPDPADRYPEMKQWLENLIAAANLERIWRSPLPPLPAVPDIGYKLRPGDKVELARFLPPKDVRAGLVGRSVARVEPPMILGEGSRSADGTDDYRVAFNWVTVTGTFERAAQEREFRDAGYKPGRQEHYIVGVDLERRERLWDGTWADWKEIRTWAPVAAADAPKVRVIETRVDLMIDPNDREVLETFATNVRYPLNQLELMRPVFPYREAGDYWKLPAYQGIDIRALDEEYFLAAQQEPEDRYADSLAEADREPSTGEMDLDARIQAIQAKVEQGFVSEEDAQALLDTVEDMISSNPSASRSQKEALDDLQTRIEDAIQAGHWRPPRVAGPRSPREVVWAFDLLPQSVESGRTYQYRMRLRFYNRYSVFPADLKNPSDAETVVVASEWSEPTDPVTIPLDTEFFLASVTRQDVVKAEIYKWVDGDWVKQVFPLAPGERISGRKRMQLPSNPEGGRVAVDFDTGATVLDIDLQRAYEPVTRSSEGGFTVKPAKTTVAVVYIDANGRLKERLLALDRESEARKAFRKLTLASLSR